MLAALTLAALALSPSALALPVNKRTDGGNYGVDEPSTLVLQFAATLEGASLPRLALPRWHCRATKLTSRLPAFLFSMCSARGHLLPAGPVQVQRDRPRGRRLLGRAQCRGRQAGQCPACFFRPTSAGPVLTCALLLLVSVSLSQLGVFSADEQAHSTYLDAALTGAGLDIFYKTCTLDFSSALGSVTDYAAYARAFETIGVGAYIGAAPLLTGSLLVAASTIATVEARHSSFLNALNGGDFSGSPYDISLAPSAVATLVSPYVSGCDLGASLGIAPGTPLGATVDGDIAPGAAVKFTINGEAQIEGFAHFSASLPTLLPGFVKSSPLTDATILFPCSSQFTEASPRLSSPAPSRPSSPPTPPAPSTSTCRAPRRRSPTTPRPSTSRRSLPARPSSSSTAPSPTSSASNDWRCCHRPLSPVRVRTCPLTTRTLPAPYIVPAPSSPYVRPPAPPPMYSRHHRPTSYLPPV